MIITLFIYSERGDLITSTTEKIKILMIKCGLNQKELSAKLGISQPALSKKFKLDDWRDSDLRKIASACNAEYEVIFKLNNEIV